jgi:3'-phosphoadenosine 5'-phosphosulfate sulfotransferase (PAPS reductase)/FAD synthetase
MVEEHPTGTADMTYVVSLSGGVGSAVAAERALSRYGTRVKLWFSDVRHEDEDLYRFMTDTARRWWQIYGARLYIHRNTRNPLVVAEQKVIIPNERRAPCSHELKIVPFRKYIAELPKPITVMLGMDWKEQHRLDAPRKGYDNDSCKSGFVSLFVIKRSLSKSTLMETRTSRLCGSTYSQSTLQLSREVRQSHFCTNRCHTPGRPTKRLATRSTTP